MNEKLFQKNLELWAKDSPKQAFMLPYVNAEILQFCESDFGELNLKKVTDETPIYYHSTSSPKQEAEHWFKSLSLRNIPLLYVFGVGLGYYYLAAKPWLKKDKKRRLIFLENDQRVIHRLFETELGTQILQDKQVHLIYFRDLYESDEAFENIYWNYPMSTMQVSGLEMYVHQYAELYAELQQKIAYDSAVKNALLDEYLKYGGAFFINYYQNMLCLADSYLGNNFFDKFRAVPAIICGAGPSLDKNIPLLKKLHDKAIIFAGGSALNVLNAYDFQPHFGAGIDPNAMQYKRLSSNQAFEVPFFYRNRMFHDAFKMIHGPRLYITGSGGYDTSEYFEEKFNIEAGFLDEGHNVVNFCVEVANAMGCNPIIFVGMDLAFTGMKAYAHGVVEDASADAAEIIDTEDYDTKKLTRSDIYGNPTSTLWKWIAEAQWIGDYAKSHNLIKMINCTEGGIGFPGVPNKSLAEVAEKLLTQSYELHNRIYGEIQNSAMPQVTYRKLVKAMRDLDASLKRTVEHFKTLIEDNRNKAQRIEQGIDKEYIQSGLAALAETELNEEIAYRYIIEMFNLALSRMLSRELHEINTRKGSKKKKILARLELNLKKLNFLKETAEVNLSLIDFALKEREKQKKIKPPKLEISKTDDSDLNIETTFDERDVFKLLYPGGNVKEEVFYKDGALHGPATFWSNDGKVLAKSWYVDGKLQGKCWWYYHSGALYSLQRFREGLWDGRQEFYHEDGTPKTIMEYKMGILQSPPILG